MSKLVATVENTFAALQKQEVDNLRVAISAIKRLDSLKAAFLKQDRDGLFSLTKDFFQELRQEFGITHFYFHQLDRVNFLRVHQPDRFGDLIQRESLKQAQARGEWTSGLELGPLGTMALRTVFPWHDGERLIGYLEMGKEIDSLMMEIRQPVFLFASKEKFSSIQQFDQYPHLDLFANMLLVNAEPKVLPPFLKSLEVEFSREGKRYWYNMSQEDDHFNLARLPILDSKGRELAWMGIVQDVTDSVHHSQRVIWIGIVVGVVCGIGLILLFWALLDRLEKKLHRADIKLLDRATRLSMILENAFDGIITIDANGVVEEINPSAETMFGYPKEVLLGKKIADFIIPSEFRQAHKIGLEKGGSSTLKKRLEVPALRVDGQVIDVELTLLAICLDGKKHYTAFLRDITERKQLLKSLRETLDVVESVHRMKSEFLANMSHEIRTPMNTIVGLTDLILNTHLSFQEQRRHLEIIQKSSESLMELINSILDFSKIDAGMVTLERIPFDLSGQVENALESLAVKAHQKDLELNCQIDPAVPMTLIGDSLRLRQVLINLVNNAIKFTSEGDVVVRIEPSRDAELENSRSDGIWLHFSVMDTGVGIPKEKQFQIFERFTQVDGSTTRKHGGTGLGLAICKQLVLLMGGKIWLDDGANGCGSAFHF
ncbi:MAG: PAS domain S-box protein, partial [Magnetococcales bacterium]|nr:PAS domain S-box protein [Magnetococcales bacterium]